MKTNSSPSTPTTSQPTLTQAGNVLVPGTGPTGFPVTEDIADLARRWSRAIQRGRGIRIEAADLDLLTDIGVNDIIQAAAAKKLKERAKWRADQRSADSMTAMPTGSIGTGGPMEASDPRISQSSGMTQNEDAIALLAHAQQISQPPGRR